MHPGPEPPLYQNLTKAARYFGVSKPSMYDAIKAGHILCVRWGCRSLVNMPSAKRHFDSLPSVTEAPSSRTRGAPGTTGPVGSGNGKTQSSSRVPHKAPRRLRDQPPIKIEETIPRRVSRSFSIRWDRTTTRQVSVTTAESRWLYVCGSATGTPTSNR
jgi:hypothetical protein